MRKPENILLSLSVALLCLSSAATAHGDPLTFTATREFPAGAGPAVPNPGCGAFPPNLLTAPHPGTGTSNLGSFASTERHCVNVATGNLSNGQFTFDFGGGNTLFGTYVGVIDAAPLPPPTGVANVSLTYTLAGGTGTFVNATGTLFGVGTINFSPAGTASRIEINGTVNVIPEPTTLFLLGTGLAGVCAAVRKRRSSTYLQSLPRRLLGK